MSVTLPNALGRPADFIIGEKEDPYLLRWFVIPKNRFFNIYLHYFIRPDDDRALHCHPWPSVGIILREKYIEHMPINQKAWKKNGDRRCRAVVRKKWIPVFRRAEHIHRVELFSSYESIGSTRWFTGYVPVWTLFITGPRIREWFFWCDHGPRHWKDFVSKTEDGNAVGKGCE